MYKLNIYTWPACQGISANIRESEHATPQQAIEYLNSVTEAYSFAVLSQRTARGWGPCDWQGNTVKVDQGWPKIPGANWGKTHPDLQSLLDDYDFLVKETARIQNEEQPHKGTISIATELLAKRHPNTVGWGEKIGWAAVDLRK